MKRNTIRLTEAQLHKIIKESVRRIIREATDCMPGTRNFGYSFDGDKEAEEAYGHGLNGNNQGIYDMTHKQDKSNLYSNQRQQELYNWYDRGSNARQYHGGQDAMLRK